jgi:hypothetical protein
MVQSDDAACVAWAEYIVERAGAKTDAEKIRAVCLWYARNIEYDGALFAGARDLPANEYAADIPRHDHLSVLASVASYAAGCSKTKPAGLCGSYVYGAAGSLRALGIPVKIEIGAFDRTASKGERYYDARGTRRVSKGKGETPHRYFNGKWVKISDLHARLSIWVESEGRRLSADPTFDSVTGGDDYFDMSEAKYAERWTFLYVSSERTPKAWRDNPSPTPFVPAPPEGTVKPASGGSSL